MLEKILISRCFLGDKVRYNGQIIRLNHPLVHLWQQEQRLIAICPEVAGGLPVPRPPAEIQASSGEIMTLAGDKVTSAFTFGAKQALAMCKQYNIRYALLKESSPSCGSQLIYDGSFTNKKIAGQGITSRLLTNAGITVFSEQNIEKLADLLDKHELTDGFT